MQYIKKSRVPLWAWILMVAGFAAVVILATLHFVGMIDLGFLGVAFLGAFMWASIDIVNATLVTVLYTAFVALVCYVVIKYFVGQKVIVPSQQPVYTPQVGLSQPTMTYQPAPTPEKKEETTST